MRLDLFLYQRGLVKSRTNASNLIKMGKVLVDGEIEIKPSKDIGNTSKIDVIKDDNYASLGGIKLKKALLDFNYQVKNKICIDIGASNGGFTDVLLKNGAKKVYAVDVSECALPKELQEDDRVVIKDKLNVRFISFDDIGLKADLITIDVSFISLSLVIPPIMQFLDNNSSIIALFKPQFEVGKAHLTKSGIVKNRQTELKALNNFKEVIKSLGLKVSSVTDAPHPFSDKNQEYLLLITP